VVAHIQDHYNHIMAHKIANIGSQDNKVNHYSSTGYLDDMALAHALALEPFLVEADNVIADII